MRLGRFERRILAAIIAVGLVAVSAALWLGYGAVREAYQVGVNERVLDQLERSLEIYRRHFVSLRQDAEHIADAVAFDRRLHAALEADDREAVEGFLEEALSRYPTLARVVVEDRAGVERARTEEVTRLDQSRHRVLELERAIPEDGRVVVTVSTDAALFREYQEAGELVGVYARLVGGTTYVSSSYLGVYIAFLLAVIVVALAVGIFVSRRVTRRVAVLAEATERVGRGDLWVEVPTDGRDEVAELTRAFNAMVRDIRDSRDRIEYLQRIGAWQELARRLAHEIKNPLTPIQLAVQEVHRTYVRNDDGADPRYRRILDDAVAIVEEEVATLRRLVGEFSEFARLPVVALEQADLGAFVHEALRGLDPAAMLPETGPTRVTPVLQLEISDEVMPVRIDAQMMRRALDNLVRNAVQAVAAEPSTAGGRVIVAARLEGSNAVLEVRDDGPGIPEAARARVFDPYYTTKGEGTGLGLAIVKKVVLEHGGSIECARGPEGGAVFRVRLPRGSEE